MNSNVKIFLQKCCAHDYRVYDGQYFTEDDDGLYYWLECPKFNHFRKAKLWTG